MNADELRDLDRRMAAIMGWAEIDGWWFSDVDGTKLMARVMDWHPTEDIRQAMVVADRLWELGYLVVLTIGRNIRGERTADCTIWKNRRDWLATASRVEVAICLAAKATEGER